MIVNRCFLLGENPMTRIVLNFGNLGVYSYSCCSNMPRSYVRAIFRRQVYTQSPSLFYLSLAIFSNLSGRICVFVFILPFKILFPIPPSVFLQKAG